MDTRHSCVPDIELPALPTLPALSLSVLVNHSSARHSQSMVLHTCISTLVYNLTCTARKRHRQGALHPAYTAE